MSDQKNDVAAIDALGGKYRELTAEIGKVIVGQAEVVEDVILSIFANGHCLLVGVPGLAKTLLVNTVSQALGLSFSRIQFTPDLMPSDIVGSEIIDESRSFKFVKGPVFANIVLADEINRTPPKTQSALLEAMQERSVTAAGVTYKLEQPFFVLATQNPIEQEGTYPLPEAQLDRFMFNINLDYPTFDEELEIVKRTTGAHDVSVKAVISGDEIREIQALIRRIPVNDQVLKYAVQIASRTRPNAADTSAMVRDYLSWGAGPRASQYLVLGAKAHAAIRGKYTPDQEDVRAVAPAVLRHRVVRNYKAEAEGIATDAIIASLF